MFRAGQEVKLEEMSLQTRETKGRNDVGTNASESSFVFRSCSYPNVGVFLGTKSDADDANTQTNKRTRPLEQAVELLRNGSVSSSFSDNHTCFRHKLRAFATRLWGSLRRWRKPTKTVASVTRAHAEKER